MVYRPVDLSVDTLLDLPDDFAAGSVTWISNLDLEIDYTTKSLDRIQLKETREIEIRGMGMKV